MNETNNTACINLPLQMACTFSSLRVINSVEQHVAVTFFFTHQHSGTKGICSPALLWRNYFNLSVFHLGWRVEGMGKWNYRTIWSKHVPLKDYFKPTPWALDHTQLEEGHALWKRKCSVALGLQSCKQAGIPLYCHEWPHWCSPIETMWAIQSMKVKNV